MRNMDINRTEYRSFFDNTRVQLFLITLVWILINFVPKYSSAFYFLTPGSVSDGELQIYKILIFGKAILLTVAWMAASCCNKSALTVLEGDVE
jgi:hypothetical protein